MGPLPFSCWSAMGHSFSFPPQPLTSLPPVLLHHLSSYAHPPCLPVRIIPLSFCPPVLFVLQSFSSSCPHPSVLLSSHHSVHLILFIFPSPHSSVFLFFCLLCPPVRLIHLSFCPPVTLSPSPSFPPVPLILPILLSFCPIYPPFPPVVLGCLEMYEKDALPKKKRSRVLLAEK